MAGVPTRSAAIARHVEAAKRLLRELEQQAGTALDAFGRDDDTDVLTAVSERDRILAQLDQVVEALSSERAAEPHAEQDPELTRLFSEMAAAAAAALESQNKLSTYARRERDRIAAQLQRSGTPDVVAHQYAAVANAGRPRTLSVTG